MSDVDWRKYEMTRVFEDAVATLVSRLHPDAERIDGAGGDGGRDLQIRRPGSLALFELKSFTGRLSKTNPNRRSQVEDSLLTAAALQPDEWTLVVPIDHNEGELKWFDGLCAKYPFPLHWRGRTWLNDQMTKFSDVRRYYFEDAAREVLALLKELNQEQAALAGGVGDAISRAVTLRNRLNELDPQYRIELSAGPATAASLSFPDAIMYEERGDANGVWTLSVIPKYKNADRDRPIQIKTNLSFGGDTSLYEDFKKFMAYGSLEPLSISAADLHVDAPAGLGGYHQGGKISLTAPVQKVSIPLAIRTVTPVGIPLASLEIPMTQMVRGSDGFTLYGEHPTRHLTLELQVDMAGRARFQFATRAVDEFDPMQLLPVLRLLVSLRKPNHATLALAGGQSNSVGELPDVELAESEFLRFVSDAGRVQFETGTVFPVPGEITVEQAATLTRVIRLLDGQEISLRPKTMSWTYESDTAAPSVGDILAHLAVQFIHSERWFDRDIPLGFCHAIGGPWRVASVVKEGSATVVAVEPLGETELVLRRGKLVEEEYPPDMQRVLLPQLPTPSPDEP